MTYSGRRITASGSALYTPTHVEGTLPAYNGLGAELPHQHRGRQRAEPRRAASSRRRPTPPATSTSSLANSSFASVRGGYFYDNYKDTGIPNTTNYTYQTSSVGAGAASRRACRVRSALQNTPRALIVDKDTTKRGFINADYNHAFRVGGYHTLKGGFGYQRTVNDAQQAYPGGYVDIFWDSTLHLPGRARRPRHLRLLRGQQPRRPGQGRREHHRRSTCRISGRSAIA